MRRHAAGTVNAYLDLCVGLLPLLPVLVFRFNKDAVCSTADGEGCRAECLSTEGVYLWEEEELLQPPMFFVGVCAWWLPVVLDNGGYGNRVGGAYVFGNMSVGRMCEQFMGVSMLMLQYRKLRLI